MKEAIKALKNIKGQLAANPALKTLIGGNPDSDISKAITHKPELNMTKLNQEHNFQSYISISINKVEAFETQDMYYIKVNVVVDQVNLDNPAELALGITGEVIRELTVKELKFAFPEQLVFGEAEETYFDLDNKTWGYVLIFATGTSPVSSS